MIGLRIKSPTERLVELIFGAVGDGLATLARKAPRRAPSAARSDVAEIVPAARSRWGTPVRRGVMLVGVAGAVGTALVLKKWWDETGAASGALVAPAPPVSVAASAAGKPGFFESLVATAKRAVSAFLEDDVLTLAAALTFATLLSFAPLILLALAVTSAIGPGAQEALLAQFAALAGNDARLAAQAVIDSANERPALGSFAGMTGLAVALVGATAVFGQLQTSLNDIWQIKAKPTGAVWGWLRRRVISIGLLVSIGFVLCVSLIVSAALSAVLTGSGVLWSIVDELISIAVFGVLFAGLFRYLPDARIPWRHALGGGLVTAVLFAFGKWLIALYLAHSSVGGAYGAAGSLVVLLVWVYYSSAIFFFGAEMVKGYLAGFGERVDAIESGERIAPASAESR